MLSWAKKRNGSAKRASCMRSIIACFSPDLKLNNWPSMSVGSYTKRREGLSPARLARTSTRYAGAIRTRRSTPSRQRSNTPVLQHSNTPTLQHSNTPTLQHSNTPSLQHSITPSLHHSITPSLHHSAAMRIHFFILIALSLVLSPALAEESAKPAGTPLGGIESNYSIKDFHFSDGETLPELRIHYRTLGKPISSSGHVQNAVLLLHGTSSTGDAFLAQGFRSPMFGPGQPLDASKYYVILPDSIGLGGSSKPSDGLHDRFPHYGYQDMVAAQKQLVTQGLGVNHL